VWEGRKAEAQREASWADARANTIRQKLDRLEQAYIFEQAIDAQSYERHRDRLRQELTLAQIDRHTTTLEELDVQGILAFAERLLPSAANIWIQASLEQKQRLQALFFPEGITFDGTAFYRTNITGCGFGYLERSEAGGNEMVSPLGVEPRTNRLRVCCSAN
jgi:hypothetical protein